MVRGIRQGRRIYDNLRKAMAFIVAIHVPIAGLAILTIASGHELLLTPMLIALLELIIDPACSVVLEAEREESDVMIRPPRDPDARLLSSSVIGWSLMQGLTALGVVSTVFLVASRRGGTDFAEVRTVTYVSLILAIVVLVLTNRSFSTSMRTVLAKPNPTMWWGLAAAVGVLGLILSIGRLRDFLTLGPLHADDLAVLAGVALVLMFLLQTLKRVWHSRLRF